MHNNNYIANESESSVNLNNISEREFSVLECLVEGMNNNEIAEKLVISKLTVENHLKRLFKKLNVKNRTQAAVTAIRLKLID